MVSWHQDVTIAVRARGRSAGVRPWSVKDGVPHVQAPAELLEQMITLRLHLDDCDERQRSVTRVERQSPVWASNG
jgi:hypothetical protein